MTGSDAAAVVLDTEFTSWEGALARNWSGPGEHREIVQIGAVRVDARFRPLECFVRLIRPRINPVLSAYFETLTGITQARLDAEAVDFEAAYRDYLGFARDLPVFCNGRDDEVFAETLALHGLTARFPPPRARDIRPWFARQGFDLAGVHAGRLAALVGAAHDLPAHDALGDALGVAAAIAHRIAAGVPGPLGPAS